MTVSLLHLTPCLCLFCVALSSQVPAENAAVVWTRPGRAFTIQCRHPELGQDSLTLKRGIDRSDVLFMNSESRTIKTGFKDRLEINGAFPKPDILIKNLTSDDIGPYWCCYTKIDNELNEIQETEGTGSVLLVVSDPECTPSIKDPVLVSIVIAAVVLCGILIGLVVWVIKTTTARGTRKPRRVTTNDVYEDMRGTLRR